MDLDLCIFWAINTQFKNSSFLKKKEKENSSQHTFPLISWLNFKGTKVKLFFLFGKGTK